MKFQIGDKVILNGRTGIISKVFGFICLVTYDEALEYRNHIIDTTAEFEECIEHDIARIRADKLKEIL